MAEYLDGKKKKEQKPYLPEYLKFWREHFKHDKEGNVVNTEIKIDLPMLIDLLQSFGFYRYDIDKKDHIYVHVIENIVSEVTRTHIIDYVKDRLKEWSKKYLIDDPLSWAEIFRKFYASLSYCFKEDILNLLEYEKDFVFMKDKVDTMYFPFLNGVAVVTKDGMQLKEYKDMDVLIWKDQIIDFILKPTFQVLRNGERLDLEHIGNYGKFLYNISGKKIDRFDSLCSIIGYNLHFFFDAKMKATILTDSSLSENPEGRTGKTLVGKALAFMRATVEINGKEFDVQDKFKYQELELNTQVMIINDLPRYFDIEALFNDITEGIKVNYKGLRSFKVRTKIMLSSNKTIKIQGGSARDRVIIYELANHYSDKFSPKDEFKQWFFSRDWPLDEWNKMYNAHLYCAYFYLQNGLVEPTEINLSKRNLIDHTCQEFVYWIEEEAKLEQGKPYGCKALYEQFRNAYPDAKNWDKFRTQQFNRYMSIYAESVKMIWHRVRRDGNGGGDQYALYTAEQAEIFNNNQPKQLTL